MFQKITLILLMLLSYSISAQQLSIVTEHLAPFQIVEKNNQITGFSTEVVRDSLNRAGYTYEIHANIWTLSYQEVLKNDYTCIYSIAYTRARKKYFQWIGEIARSTSSFYSLRTRNISLNNIEEAKLFHVAVIKDDVTYYYLLSKGFKVGENLYVMENYDALLQLLEKRQYSIDLIILNDELLKNRVNSAAEQFKYKKLLNIDELKLNFYLACNLNMPKIIVNKLSKSLLEIKSDGTYDKIKKKWQKYFSN